MNKRILFFPVVLLSTVLCGQDFENLGFESPCNSLSNENCSWTKSWGSENCWMIKSEGANSYLSISGEKETSVSFIEQATQISELAEIKLLEVTARIRTNEILGKGAGINIGMYNQEGELISTKDMGGFYSQSWITHSNSWETYSLKAICPIGTSSIKIGAIVYGNGVADFDDFNIHMLSIDNRKPSLLAKSYISEAIKIISENSLVRDSIDTALLKQKALLIAGNAENYSECYLAIEYLLESLRTYGDEHSFFMTAQEADNWENNSNAAGRTEFPNVKRIDNVGYMIVPPFHGGNENLIKAYADSLQNGIRSIISKDLIGWIIDLRQNTGGNMEPMIAGLGPLLDGGKIGSLIDINGDTESWFYRDGTYFWEEEEGISVSIPLKLKNKLPIAVLISAQTGSSGEVVAISFIGNTNTKLFGEHTWGLTTGNGEFALADGSKIFLASTKMMDRNGKIYSSFIEPDFKVIAHENHDEDEVLKAALEWIEKK